MSKLWVRNADNTAWINARNVPGFRVRNADNTGWINKSSTLAGVRVRNATDDGWISFEPQVRTLDFTNKNDLDFTYLQGSYGGAGNHVVMTCTIDVSRFYSRTANTLGLNHVVFALDCRGASHVPSYDPTTGTYTADHCGPIIRGGEYLWGGARGFILLADGSVQAEHWYDWKGFVLEPVGGNVDLVSNPVLHVTLIGGYRSGPYANTMQIIFRRENEYGAVLFTGQRGWGWDWSGASKVAVAMITEDFKDPSLSGCVEELVTRPTSLGAQLTVTDLEVTYG